MSTYYVHLPGTYYKYLVNAKSKVEAKRKVHNEQFKPFLKEDIKNGYDPVKQKDLEAINVSKFLDKGEIYWL